MSTEQIQKILEEKDILFEQGNTVADFFRLIIWWICRALFFLSEKAESAIDSIYSLLDVNGLLESTQVGDFLEFLKPVFFGFMAAGILFLGFKVLFGSVRDKSSIPASLVICMLVILGLPTMISTLSDITNLSVQSVKGEYNAAAFTTSIALSSIHDLRYYDDQGWDNAEPVVYSEGDLMGTRCYNRLSAETYKNIDINEKMDPEDTGLKDKDLYGKYLVLGVDNKYMLKDIDYGGWLDIFPHFYYRYHVDWLLLVVCLLATTVALIFTGLKVAVLLIDIIRDEIIATALAAVDFETAQKVKEAVKGILACFVTIFATAVFLRLYFLLVVIERNLYTSDKIGVIAFSILIIVTTYAVIDGPDMMRRLFGIDAGVRSGWHMAMGALGLGMAGARIGKGIARRFSSGRAQAGAGPSGRTAVGSARSSGGKVGGTSAGPKTGSRPGSEKPGERPEDQKTGPAKTSRAGLGNANYGAATPQGRKPMISPSPAGLSAAGANMAKENLEGSVKPGAKGRRIGGEDLKPGLGKNSALAEWMSSPAKSFVSDKMRASGAGLTGRSVPAGPHGSREHGYYRSSGGSGDQYRSSGSHGSSYRTAGRTGVSDHNARSGSGAGYSRTPGSIGRAYRERDTRAASSSGFRRTEYRTAGGARTGEVRPNGSRNARPKRRRRR